MRHTRIEQKVLILKQEALLPNGLKFPAGTEIEIVNDVTYIGGFPVQFNINATILRWVNENPTLFKDDTRKF